MSIIVGHRNERYHLRKSSKLIVNGTNGLLDGLFESSSDAHNFTDTLHAAAEEFAHAVELLKIPARNLDDDVIKRGLEAR